MTTGSSMDAVGPETYTYTDLVCVIRAAIRSRSRGIIHLPKWMIPLLSQPLSWLLSDVLLTRDELRELTGNVLRSHINRPRAQLAFVAWLNAHVNNVGIRYASVIGAALPAG